VKKTVLWSDSWKWVVNSSLTLKDMKIQEIYEELYKYHFNLCTNTTTNEFEMKLRFEGGVEIPNPKECKVSLKYFDEFLKTLDEEELWIYKTDKEVMSLISEFVDNWETNHKRKVSRIAIIVIISLICIGLLYFVNKKLKNKHLIIRIKKRKGI